MDVNVRAFGDICLSHIDRAGGKSTSLREIVGNLSGLGVRVPDGFATTAEALKRFIGDTGLAERISPKLRDLDTDDTQRLAGVGREIREEVAKQRFPEDLECEVRETFERVCGRARRRVLPVRASATAQDCSTPRSRASWRPS